MDLKDLAYKLATEPDFAERLRAAEDQNLPPELSALSPEEVEAIRVYVSKGCLYMTNNPVAEPTSEDWWRP